MKMMGRGASSRANGWRLQAKVLGVLALAVLALAFFYLVLAPIVLVGLLLLAGLVYWKRLSARRRAGRAKVIDGTCSRVDG